MPPERKTITGKISEKETIKFTNHPPQVLGHQRLCDVIHKRPCVTREASKAKTPREAFELYITPDMIEELVNRTNNRIKKTLENLSQNTYDNDKYPCYKEIDHLDIYAFFGLFYMRGLYNLNNHKLSILFSEKPGIPVFGATMSLLRFKFILAHLCFDDEDTHPQCWQNDRFAAF